MEVCLLAMQLALFRKHCHAFCILVNYPCMCRSGFWLENFLRTQLQHLLLAYASVQMPAGLESYPSWSTVTCSVSFNKTGCIDHVFRVLTSRQVGEAPSDPFAAVYRGWCHHQ